jgi:hypothetical protein
VAPLPDRLAEQLAELKKALLAMEACAAQCREVIAATRQIIAEAETTLAATAGVAGPTD